MNLKKISIGTASFGRLYGILDKKIIKNDAKLILQFAMNKKIDHIDTAMSYGESENIIGMLSPENWGNKKVSTKIGKIPTSSTQSIHDIIDERIEKSLERLRIRKIYNLYLHYPDQLLEKKGEKIFDSLIILKKTKKIENIGYSFYDPRSIEKFLEHFKPDVVQIPFNLFDQRLIKNNYYMKYVSKNVKINIRSIYLQGLLLTKICRLPKKIINFKKDFSRLYDYASGFKLKPIDICNSFLMNYDFYNNVIVGFNNVNELKTFVNLKKENFNFNFSQFASENKYLISPKEWS